MAETISTETVCGLSKKMFLKICRSESGHDWGFSMSSYYLNGYGNDKGHKTYGYGSLYYPDGKKFMDQVQQTYTQTELENIYMTSVKNHVAAVQQWAQKNKINFKQCQLDAVVSACYNFGNGFLKKSVCELMKKNPNDPSIVTTWEHLSDAQAESQNLGGLKKRRWWESHWYNGEDVIDLTYDGKIDDSGAGSTSTLGGNSGGAGNSYPPNSPRPIMASRGQNTVYKLSFASDIAKPVNETRKDKFAEMQENFKNTAPELGRDIILADGTYGVELLKGQDAKVLRTGN